MTTFSELYADRCYVNQQGDLKPHFWKPQPIERTDFTLFADETMVCEESWGVSQVCDRILALGLHLEIPVGEFVNQASKRDLPQDAVMHNLLKSNIADEAVHYKGFVNAVESYNTTWASLKDAANCAEHWQNLTCHPIEAAQALETGIFLDTLGFLRLAGGKSLVEMASQIARDEYRHVATNRGILAALGYPMMPDFWNLVEETLSWVFEGLNIPKSAVGIKIDTGFFVNAGRSLLTTGEARQLDDLVNYAAHKLPFEIGNAKLYSREVGVG